MGQNPQISPFFYSPRKLGGLGLTPALFEYCTQSIVCAFRFLTSLDQTFCDFIIKHLHFIVSKRLNSSHSINIHTILLWLSDKIKSSYHPSSTWWTKTRFAVRKLRKHNIDINFLNVENEFIIKVSTSNDKTYLFNIANKNKV